MDTINHLQPINAVFILPQRPLRSGTQCWLIWSQYWLDASPYKQNSSYLLLLSSTHGKLSTIVTQINLALSCSIGTAHTGILQFLQVYCTFPCFLGLSLCRETLILFIPHQDRCTSMSSSITIFRWEGPTFADLNEQTMHYTKSQPRAFTLAWGLIHKEADAKFPLSCRSLF